jgi:hypothetical protein
MTRIHNPQAYELIGFEVNKGKKHKYDAILKNKKTGELKRIGFGGKYPDGTPYPQYKDQLGYYSKYDHEDEKRRQNWLSRHKKNIGYKFSSAFFSREILW